MLDLSIVIVSWNTRSLLRDCLLSVHASLLRTPTLRAEIFVVDNASTDGSPALVRALFPGVCVLENAENVGFARANNQALRQARGRYALLLNSDTLVPEAALAALVRALEANPAAAVAGPLLLNTDGSVQHSWARFPGWKEELFGTLDRSQTPYARTDFDDVKTRATMQPFVCDWVGGACFCVRTSVMQQAGLLDEGFFFFSEELEWCHRIKRLTGSVTLLVPSVAVTHHGGGSSQPLAATRRRQLWRSRLRYYRRTHGVVRGLVPSLIATARYLLAPRRRSTP